MLFSKIKVVYATFLFSFSVWLTLVFIYGFPSLNGFFQVEFSSSTYLGFFVGSAIVSSVSCLLIGLKMIGLKTEIKRKKITAEKNGSIYDLNLSTKEIPANTLNLENDSVIELEKTKKKAITLHSS